MNTSEYIPENDIIKVNMKPLYQALIRFREGKQQPSIHVNVLKDLPNGKNVLHFISTYGYDYVLLKEDSIPKMRGRLLAELGKMRNRNLSLYDPKEHYVLDSKNLPSNLVKDLSASGWGLVISHLQALCLKVSEALNINCPQIILVPDYQTGGTLLTACESEVVAVILRPSDNFHEVVYGLVHELRHGWQIKYHPELKDHYSTMFDCKEKYGKKSDQVYRSQIAEFDAEVFACATVKRVYYDWVSNGPLLTTNTDVYHSIEKAADRFFPTIDDVFTATKAIPNYRSVYPNLIA